jgi:2-polyprenyl-3-methyl-5-hydroxy-6-metoxy-1,4-benzoquinol methylase
MASEWAEIFEDRGFLRFDRSGLRSWTAENRAFFGSLGKLFTPGKTILDVGSGPGRHACGAASLGYRVVGIDRDPQMVAVATDNARAALANAKVTFHVMDMVEVADAFPGTTFDVLTHGGLLEHLASAAEMRSELRRQLRLAANLVFDVPLKTRRNEELFARDKAFRHVRDACWWRDTVLGEFSVVHCEVELRTKDGMTDDFVAWVSRSGEQN